MDEVDVDEVLFQKVKQIAYCGVFSYEDELKALDEFMAETDTLTTAVLEKLVEDGVIPAERCEHYRGKILKSAKLVHNFARADIEDRINWISTELMAQFIPEGDPDFLTELRSCGLME